MSTAKCPYCASKLQIPNNIASGMAMMCGNCNNQFLPPVVERRRDSDDDEEEIKPRKKKRRGKKKMATNTVVTITILGAIVALLGTLGIFYLMQPSHSKFNEAIVSQYNRFSTIMQTTMQVRRATANIPSFLRQFQPLSAQLQPILKELKEIQAPEDSKHVLQSFNTLVETLIRFSDTDSVKLADRLRRQPNDEEALRDMVTQLVQIAQYHDSLVQGQHGMAKKHGLLQIQPQGDQGFFVRDR